MTIRLSSLPNEGLFNISFAYDQQLVDIIKELPDRSWDPTARVWTAPCDLETLNQIYKLQELWQFTIDIDDSIKEDIADLYKTEEVQKRRIEEIKELKNKTYTDVGLDGIIFGQLFPYQMAGHEFIKATDGKCIIGDEPGVGKTLQAISYAAKYCKRTLIICPASLKYIWQSEIKKFAHVEAQVLSSGDRVDPTVPFIITNYEILASRTKGGYPEADILQLLKKDKKTKQIQIDCVIIDEAHRMKSLATGWTKWIHKRLKDVPRKILLTGTPMKSRPMEFFSLLKFIDKQYWNSKTRYGLRYCNGKYTHFGWDYSGASNLDELYEKTIPYMIRRHKMDVIADLPEKTYIRTPMELDLKDQREYQYLLSEYLSSAQMQLDKMAFNLEQIQKLKQFTSNIKVKQATEVITDLIAAGKKVVVFSFFVDVAKKIAENFYSQSLLFTGATPLDDRFKMVEDFQTKPQYKVFSGTVGAAGVGLTLTAADTVIFIDLPWTPGDLQQAADRCHRVGQKNAVSVIMLECKNTVDEYIAETLEAKQLVISKALDNIDASPIADTSVLKEVLSKLLQQRK